MAKPLYLTTTLPYVNADPHIGFALEIVHADIVARSKALMGADVFFNTGTDEHGLKIFQKAKEMGTDPQRYVDEYAAKFRGLQHKLGISDALRFIRTTDAHHKAAAQAMWRRCLAQGDIYKKKYKGLYCVGDEMFLKEADLVNGTCPNHPNMDPIEIEEENYFFRLSAYQDRLVRYLSHEGVVVPEWRRQEALQFVQRGLEDFSISRDASRLPWGVPVPDDDTQVMYVWFDALTNYISTLGWPDDTDGNFATYWEGGDVLQMAGKDQVRFQSIMWQAMLMSAGVKNSDRVIYHGFITSGGQKMSKSLGNVIDPYAIVDEYGADALRYFLARHVHPFEDSDVTMDRFKETYNADLANGIGNLASRVLTLSERHLSTPVERREVPGGMFDELVETYRYDRFLEGVWSLIQGLDQSINADVPFKVVKEDPARGEAMIRDLVDGLYSVALQLKPFMPTTAAHIETAILANKKPENLFPRKE